MKIDVMRQLDAWAGKPLCFFATLAERLRGLFHRSPPGVGERLLIIKLSEQGAIIMLGESLRHLQQAYARDKIWVLAFEESRPILNVTGLVPEENIITISTGSLGGFLVTTLQALRHIRRLRMDAVLDLEFFSRASALLAWLSGARRRTGVHAYYGEGPWRGQLMTHGVKFNPHLHISRMFLALAEAAILRENTLQRLEFTPPPLESLHEQFTPTPEEPQRVDSLLRDCGWKEGERLILLNPNTSDRELIPLRRWDEKNYIELGRLILADSKDVRILLTGGPKEAAAVAKLEPAIDANRCRSVAGRTSMRELLALYRRSALMVTNDSGPAHFAALTELPVVVLFGPETPQLWKPLGKHVHVVHRGLACSPCFSIYNGRRSGCRRNACMDMTPEEVFAVVKKALLS
ncbi:MAG: glycosyltransferase family 9 protein [Verrucomicrobiota bacterium]